MLPVPLAVRIVSAKADKHVTALLRDLTFRAVVPGGLAEATLFLDHPLADDDPAIALYAKVYIYDARNGGKPWEGVLEDPGRASSSDGQVWTLTAIGPAAIPGDNPIVACYVDNGVESFHPIASGIRSIQVSSTDDDPPKLHMGFAGGSIVVNSSGVAISRLVEDCGQKLARFKVIWDAGVTDANYSIDLRTRATVAGAATTVKTANLNTAGGTLTAVITTDIPVTDDIATVHLAHNAAPATVGDEVHWIDAQVIQQGTRYSAAGVELTAAATYSSDTVLASDIVADLLGRVLTSFDGANASIPATTFPIDRLVYPDPTTPAQILDDLMQLEPAYFWAGWESTSTGKYRFVWQAWPTVVRYEMSITDDFDSPGNAGELYNRVIVRWRDRNGRPRTVIRTMAQADLDAAGITRTGLLDLGDNIGSQVNAQQAGDSFLADHNSPPNAGTITISQDILDLVTGRMVAPWEVRPGNLIRIRGVVPRVDGLNATARNAVTIFRLFSTEYRASTNTCSAGLDSYSRSMANQVFLAHRRLDRLRKR